MLDTSQSMARDEPFSAPARALQSGPDFSSLHDCARRRPVAVDRPIAIGTAISQDAGGAVESVMHRALVVQLPVNGIPQTWISFAELPVNWRRWPFVEPERRQSMKRNILLVGGASIALLASVAVAQNTTTGSNSGSTANSGANSGTAASTTGTTSPSSANTTNDRGTATSGSSTAGSDYGNSGSAANGSAYGSGMNGAASGSDVTQGSGTAGYQAAGERG